MKEMKCKSCGKRMDYNYHYECFECNCGKTYNYAGQELAPVEQWQDEWDNDDY